MEKRQGQNRMPSISNPMIVKFTSFQLEYGDLELVDFAIQKYSLIFPMEHPYQVPGFYPDPIRTIFLKRASKLLGHSDWKEWFRPDIWGGHTRRIMMHHDAPKYELLNPSGEGPFCRIQIEGKEYSCRRKPEDTSAFRLLYLTALQYHGKI